MILTSYITGTNFQLRCSGKGVDVEAEWCQGWWCVSEVWGPSTGHHLGGSSRLVVQTKKLT